MKKRAMFRSALCALLIAVLAPAAGVRAAQRHSAQAVTVELLVSLTRSCSSLGKNTVAALQIAAEQIETASRGRQRFRLLVRDTQLDPSKALDAIQDLDRRGVEIIIGPQSSAEMAMIKPYADAHNILVISQGSTVSSLAIA